jgi:aryl-alcohol dehydrogenase-like predicted oxidoreductase
MELRNLGPLGLRVSAQGLGCTGMSTTYGLSDDRESPATLDRAAAPGGVPVPGTRRVRYLEENIAATRVTLTQAELAALDEAAPSGAAAGDRYPAGQMPLLGR